MFEFRPKSLLKFWSILLIRPVGDAVVFQCLTWPAARALGSGLHGLEGVQIVSFK